MDNNLLDSEMEHSFQLLKVRAEESAKTLTQPHLLEWILNTADLMFEDTENIYCSLAENTHISLGTALNLSFYRSSKVRMSLLNNAALPVGVLYNLSFDICPEIRKAAESHPAWTNSMFTLMKNMKRRNAQLFQDRSLAGRDILSSSGFIVMDRELSEVQTRSKSLEFAHSSSEYWRLFAITSGYTEWYLKTLVSKTMRFSLIYR